MKWDLQKLHNFGDWKFYILGFLRQTKGTSSMSKENTLPVLKSGSFSLTWPKDLDLGWSIFQLNLKNIKTNNLIKLQKISLWSANKFFLWYYLVTLIWKPQHPYPNRGQIIKKNHSYWVSERLGIYCDLIVLKKSSFDLTITNQVS